MENKLKNFAFFAFAVFAMVLVSAGVSAATIFSENFDDGDLSGWTVTNNPTSLPGTEWTNTGSFAVAEPGFNSTDGSSILERTISTSDFQNIVVSYDRRLIGLGIDNNFTFAWSSDGTTFTTLEDASDVNDGSFVSKSFNLPSSANDKSNFKIRVTCTTDVNSEECQLDNVLVTGDATNNVDDFCSAGPQGGNLNIRNVDINNEGEGDDNEWRLLDVIEVEVEVENDGDDDIDDVTVEIGLFDSSGNNVIDDMDFESDDDEEIDLGNLNDGDEETVTFRFKVPADFEDGSYDFRVKTYSDDLGEENECDDTSNDLGNGGRFEDIDVERESDEGKFITYDNFVFSPSEATCGERIIMSFDVFNIGDEEQDRVRVRVFNAELGVNEFYEITNDLDEGDDENINVEFGIPSNAEDKTYQMRITAEYDYRNGNYRETSDSDFIDSDAALRVIGCGVGPGNGGDVAVISAQLQSDAVAGQELIVRARITSTLNSEAQFSVDVSGFESWAQLGSISDSTFTLSPGEDQEVIIEFNVDEDAEGAQSFEIEVSAQGMSESREVSVNLDGSGSGDDGGFNFGNNSYLWIIGIVNVILIILIIIVAVRISRRE